MKKRISMAVAASFFLFAISGVLAAEKSVPNVISFQSVLYDDGGNPIADGPVSVTFRIVDAADISVYEERQTLESNRGAVSALVGGGLNSDGAPTGGIPFETFDLISPRYLEVEVAGQPPMPKMEIASVPFAMHSNYALKVIDLRYEDLSEEFIDKLGAALGANKEPAGLVTREDVMNVDVRPGFIYSGATTLQGVLNDLDQAIKRRDEKINESSAADLKNLDDEKNARIQVDSSLSQSIANEAASRANADAAEAAARANADATKVSKSGDTMTGDLTLQKKLIIQSSASFGGVFRSTWPGFKTVYKKTEVYDTALEGNDKGDAFYTITSSCNTGDVLIGCSGEYTHQCWGSVSCEFLGAVPIMGSCIAKGQQDSGKGGKLYAYAICGTPY